MQITKPTKAEVMRELKDYVFITFGLISYAMGWAAFLIPYQITTGGTTGIGAIIYYATGFPIQWSYFIINAVLMTFAIKILGPKFSIKTTFAISVPPVLPLQLNTTPRPAPHMAAPMRQAMKSCPGPSI